VLDNYALMEGFVILRNDFDGVFSVGNPGELELATPPRVKVLLMGVPVPSFRSTRMFSIVCWSLSSRTVPAMPYVCLLGAGRPCPIPGRALPINIRRMPVAWVKMHDTSSAGRVY